MNIALINGSPKKSESASNYLLQDLKALLNTSNTITEFSFHTPNILDDTILKLLEYDAWVFAFPLYVDGLPSHLLSCLCRIQQFGSHGKDIHIYAIANCGFYEGKQNYNALSILKNWCDKIGFVWGMGIGLGGGGAITFLKNVPLGKGPKSQLGTACYTLLAALLSKTSHKNVYVSIGFPKFLYKIAAEINWRKAIKSNGGKRKDLDRKL